MGSRFRTGASLRRSLCRIPGVVARKGGLASRFDVRCRDPVSSRIVNSFKLVSARLLRKRDLPEVRCKLWGDHLWTPSYFAGSAGGANLATVKHYIRQQRLPTFPRGGA